MEGVLGSNNGHDNTLSPQNQQYMLNADPSVKNRVNDNTAAGVHEKKINKVDECQTCKSRRYQDGSDDPGVSFKSPTKLSPSQASSMVFSHEREHYTRENAKAREEGREVLSNSIRVFTDVCPECGKTYVSGGETTTVTRKKAEQAQSLKDFYDERVGVHKGRQMDTKI